MLIASTQQRFGVTPTSISFTDVDAHGIHHTQADALVIQAVIDNHIVWQILIDEGNFIDILYKGVFAEMDFGVNDLRTEMPPLFGFTSEATIPMDLINCLLQWGPLHSNPRSNPTGQSLVAHLHSTLL